jgi:hypothetical protein
VFTLVTDAGGHAFTVVTSGAGQAVTVGASVYTVATGNVGSFVSSATSTPTK